MKKGWALQIVEIKSKKTSHYRWTYESGRVVILDCLCVSESLENWIGLEQLLLQLTLKGLGKNENAKSAYMFFFWNEHFFTQENKRIKQGNKNSGEVETQAFFKGGEKNG